MPASAPPAIRRRSGSNFLVLNLAMDAAHPVLGHSVAWTNELARRSNHVSVITMLAGELPVEDNVTVHSLGKELGHSEPRRLLDFYRLAYRVLDERPVAACFAHMAPLFSALFAPVARRRGVPVLLWYAHSSVSPTLRIAHRLANRCVTPTPAAFRLPSSKLFVIGHGIDTERFVPPAETAPGYERTLVSVGRLSPVKRVDEMIEALAVLEGQRSLGLRLEVIGAPATRGDRAYAETLRRRVSELGLADRVAFHGSVPYGEVARQYHRGSIFLNLTPSSLDKAILESMASGCVPVSRNPGFAEIARDQGLERLVPAEGAAGVAAAVAQVVEADATARAELSGRLRGIVVQDHSLRSLGDRIVSHLEQLAALPTNGRNGSECSSP